MSSEIFCNFYQQALKSAEPLNLYFLVAVDKHKDEKMVNFGNKMLQQLEMREEFPCFHYLIQIFDWLKDAAEE